MTEPRQRLGEWLLARQQLSAEDLERALELQQRQHARLGACLVRLGALSEESLYAALSAQTGLAVADGLLDELDPASARLAWALWGWSEAWWRRQSAVAWQGVDGRVVIAAVDPWDAELREALTAPAGLTLEWRLLPPSQLDAALERQKDDAQGASRLDSQALRELAEDAPVIAFVNGVMAQAVESRASDIHFEPGEHQFEVRFRVDGVLQTRGQQPMARYPAVASRIKLVAGLDIAERRLPQDGRTSIRLAGQAMDVRVSVIPAVHGESLVLRLLPKQRQDLALDRLGLQADHLQRLRRWLDWPNGLVLVTGPTGSGKSTTLYAALAAVSDQSRKMITVEDPVEFRLPGVVQIQTQAEIGYTFARALRSILRHDPDIIMVGEIRDRETAEIAIQSALTGHLVLATLHTNDALSAVTRLVDMGIEPYLVAAALRGVMAQRLVRSLCQCAEDVPAPDEAAAARWATSPWRHEGARWRRPLGCEQCQHSGFRGRRGIYELVEFDAPTQHAIAQGATLAEITAMADAAGRRSLLDDGLLRVAQGGTTWAEVLRAAGQAEA
ncbi:GspE/PulE family protein [Inhella sp.]|uniref:GspE/PulE family protein n=1 Tax=Inhella sp. TaxID=1921806 RepID=UPI0035B194C2